MSNPTAAGDWGDFAQWDAGQWAEAYEGLHAQIGSGPAAMSVASSIVGVIGATAMFVHIWTGLRIAACSILLGVLGICSALILGFEGPSTVAFCAGVTTVTKEFLPLDRVGWKLGIFSYYLVCVALAGDVLLGSAILALAIAHLLVGRSKDGLATLGILGVALTVISAFTVDSGRPWIVATALVIGIVTFNKWQRYSSTGLVTEPGRGAY